MQINIGDKVRFLSSTGGGTVTRIVNVKEVMVLCDEDGFEIPTLKSDLVIIEGAGSKKGQANKDSNIKSEDKLTPKQESLLVEKEEVYFAFVPQDGYSETESPLNLYLINDTSKILMYTYHHEMLGLMKGVTAGNINPNSKVLITEYANKELGELSTALFQILFYQEGIYEMKAPIEKRAKIHPVKLKLTGNALEQQLDEMSQRDFKKMLSEKERSSKKTASPKQKNKDNILEIDLHINELIDSVTGLSNADILEYQMDCFHKTLGEYESKKGKQIVFIHGIGNGTLRKKLDTELRRKYKKHYSQDASFKEYGWGATMITIR